MPQTELFWSLCQQAVAAHGVRATADVERLLREAGAATGQESAPAARGHRQQHLRQLAAYLAPDLAAAALEPSALAPAPMASPALEAEFARLQDSVARLEQDKRLLAASLASMPSIDPLCLLAAAPDTVPTPEDAFGIVVFGHTRVPELEAVLQSLQRQDALHCTEVWLDGHQGNGALKTRILKTIEMVERYPVRRLHRQNGQFGFRKMLLLGLSEMSARYRDLLVLEDDCFPTRTAVADFRTELDRIRDDATVFSVYGHPFLCDSEGETCTRFQGWGWATTARKLAPVLRQLMDCYAMTEERYLDFVQLALTHEVRARIDVTPPRQPTHTLERFFAWDETLCLLTAMAGQVHRPTPRRAIYNCGMSKDSTHFLLNERFRSPPYNLITADEVWKYF